MSGLVRLAQFSLGTLATGRRTKLLLVFHTEGLVNPKIRKAMLEFGRQASGTFKPVATVITPRCPQYMTDPLKDPLRTSITRSDVPQRAEAEFKDALSELEEHYEVGFHGHFFSFKDGRYTPAFDRRSIESQMFAELDYLSELGVKPMVYAGGWWFISEDVVSLLESRGFRVNTSVNDVGRDTFGAPQPFSMREPGQPFKVGESLIEVPTFRSVRGMLAAAKSRGPKGGLIPIALHDYDLARGQTSSLARKLLLIMTEKEKLATFADLLNSGLGQVGDLPGGG